MSLTQVMINVSLRPLEHAQFYFVCQSIKNKWVRAKSIADESKIERVEKSPTGNMIENLVQPLDVEPILLIASKTKQWRRLQHRRLVNNRHLWVNDSVT